MSEHAIAVRSLQEYRTTLYPESVQDGEIPEREQQLDFHKERTLTFECECGQRFRKWGTAAEHLAGNGGDDT